MPGHPGAPAATPVAMLAGMLPDSHRWNIDGDCAQLFHNYKCIATINRGAVEIAGWAGRSWGSAAARAWACEESSGGCARAITRGAREPQAARRIAEALRCIWR